MAGYGAAQAMPGPLFAFSAYLGTVIARSWFAGLWCLAIPFGQQQLIRRSP
jgi:chromate transporter